jgi:hypothetical protein
VVWGLSLLGLGWVAVWPIKLVLWLVWCWLTWVDLGLLSNRSGGLVTHLSGFLISDLF